VSPGTTYYYAVAAEDTRGDLSPMSAVAMVTVDAGSSAPTNLMSTPTSTTRVGLTWSPPGGGLPIKIYLVYRGTSASVLPQLAITTNTSYGDNSVSAGATYYYAVAATDIEGVLSPMSAVIAVTMPTPPSPPAGLVATPVATTRASLTWSPAASGGLPVLYYQVLRGNSPDNLSPIVTVAQTSYMDTSVNQGTTYYYGAQAKDSGGDLSPMSAVATATLPMPPSAPANLVATPTSGTIASLTWSAAASGGLPVLYYQVFRGLSSSNLSLLATVEQTAFTDTTVTQGTTYYYGVEAEDSGADLSPMSAIAKLTSLTPPSPPAGLAATPASTTSVNLSWSPAAAGSLPVQFYQVFRGSSPSTLSQVGSIAQTSYTDSCLNPATTYYYGVVAADAEGDLSAMSSVVPATTTQPANAPPFNILPVATNSFSPSSANLPGLPQMTIDSVLYDDVGYQSGIVLNGKVIYNANEVYPGGSSWVNAIDNAVPMPVFMSYNASQLLAGFSAASNWTWFDASTLSWYSKGITQPGNTGPNCIRPTNNPRCENIVGGYMGRGAYVGNIYYPTPNFHNGYMVFLSYDSAKAIDDPTAYQTFVPPGYGTTMGPQYGWCSSVTDGRFVYYAPLADPVNGHSGNIFRYDTTQPFSNLETGGVTTAWSNFDMKTAPGNPGGVAPNAVGFQSVVYDGYRYIYFVPFQQTLIVRYDTWNGGSGPDPTGFTQTANYATFDPTQLGTAGYPAVAGQGNAANLAGFTGSQVVWDAANQNEYLYFVPWATFPNGALNPTLQSTAARVRIGTMTGSVWSAVDITSTATSPASSTPEWEMYDLTLLMQNSAWQCTWPQLQSNPLLSAQSSIAGWQESWVSTNGSSGDSFPPRVGFVPDTSAFLVQHDVGHHLYDSSGWYVANIPDTYNFGTMGGGYDAANAILYPASPNVPLYAFQFQ